MSTSEDNFHQFQIPNDHAVDVPVVDNPHWTAADEMFVADNLTGSTILDDQPHDQNRWHEALTYNERLGLDQAAADVERRQREVDFNETQAEATALYREGVATTDETGNTVIYLRKQWCNDDGTVNGVQAA